VNAEGDVVVDRHREGCGLLEHHADLRAQHVEIHAGVENVAPVEHDLAYGALARVERVHAVESAQQGRLATARRPDERGDAALGDLEVDVFQPLETPVIEVEMSHRDLGRRSAVGLRSYFRSERHRF